MKPITYWIQNDAINELVDLYGSQLGRLAEADRRELIAYLALGPELHSWGSSWDEAYRLTKDLTQHEKDKLIEAIAASLVHSGNPWLAAACKMSEMEKAYKKQAPQCRREAYQSSENIHATQEPS